MVSGPTHANMMPTGPVSDELLDFCRMRCMKGVFFLFESTGCAPDQHRAGGEMSSKSEGDRHLGSRRRGGRHLIFGFHFH